MAPQSRLTLRMAERMKKLYTFSMDKTTAARAQPAGASLQRPNNATFPRALSLAFQVADFIVDGIAAGSFQFGQRLIETELAAQLRVSRVPIREAVKMLEAQGILVVTPHRGARVAEFDDLKMDRIREARLALERLALPGCTRHLPGSSRKAHCSGGAGGEDGGRRRPPRLDRGR